MGSFDEDTSLVETGPGRWRGEIADRWFVGRGPNGGLLAAQAVRAMQLLVADPQRLPLSLTLHYLEAPARGPIDIVARIERSGRSITAVSLRFEQDGRALVLGLGALAIWREGGRDHDGLTHPRVARPEALEPTPPGLAGLPTFVENYDYRWVTESTGGARVSGWIRARDERPVDHVSLAAFTDAFPPAVFALLEGGTAAAPTIDLTIHFRARLQDENSGWVLGSLTSGRVAGGFFEEDGELWSEDGRLLAQSRQLAMLREPDG